LISDPGFYLVRAVRQAGMDIIPVPGPSACIAALSASGLPTDRFVFEGFLPARQHARRRRLEALRSEPRTLVFYESSHRIVDCLADMVEILGAGRAVVVARELTKTFETIKAGTLSELVAWLLGDSQQQRGEFVIMVHGEQPAADVAMDPEAERVLELLMQELPLKRAAALAAKITGLAKNRCYERGLELKKAN
ncbi:MAG: 16S rRNA (cytidine(1402)-2'-O)-methyltransferase, partial [Halobacteria archaeon]|nr:16S rRNA (cytidine(1402)-2'-O)-methyltransferase [Halobacteria archaeon]